MYSIFDIFKIGIGPSSSHTVGPMKAAKDFIESLNGEGLIEKVHKIEIYLYGSLAFTGIGHNIQNGLILGLLRFNPDDITADKIQKAHMVSSNKLLRVSVNKKIHFDVKKNIILNLDNVNLYESNKMNFIAYDSNCKIFNIEYVSIGGGFILNKGEKG